jgi:putative SOS response-associated peptidase YedK
MCVKYEVDDYGTVWGVKRSGATFQVTNEEKIKELVRQGKLVYPKYEAPVIVDTAEGRFAEVMRFGVWPFYEKTMPSRVIQNARDDSLLTKSLWRQSVATRRCLIPLVAYYEAGLGPVGARGDVRFTIRDRAAFFAAGVWDNDPDGSGNRAFAMVTTAPNATAARFHNRMPVVLDDDEAEQWLGHAPLPEDRLKHLCRGVAPEVLIPFEIPAPPKAKKITKAELSQATGQGELML